MSKFIKILISLALLVVLVVSGAYFYLKSKINDPEVRTLLRNTVEKSTGRQLDFGPISFKLSPFSLVLTGVKFTDTNKKDTFIGLDELIVEVFLDKLLKKEVHINRIILNEPEIHIREYADGSYNFSDLMGPTQASSPSDAPASSTDEEPSVAAAPQKPDDNSPANSNPPVKLNVSLFEIRQAKLTISKFSEQNSVKTFDLHNFSLKLKDISFDKPITVEMMIEIGRKTYFQFALTSSPLLTLAPDIATLGLQMTGKFQMGDLKDLELFLTDEDIAAIPVTQIKMDFDSSGSLAKGFLFNFDIKTPEVDDRNQIYMDFKNSVSLDIPEEICRQMLSGNLPNASNVNVLSLAEADTGNEIKLPELIPVLGPYLQHLTLKTHFATERFSYQKNDFTDIQVPLVIENGILTIKDMKATLFDGSFNFNAHSKLLDFPITYDYKLSLENVSVKDILKANANREDIHGKIQVSLDGSGTGTTTKNLETFLKTQFQCELQDGQKISTEGTLLDQIYVHLDHPVLLLLLPELAPKVQKAKQNMNTQKITPISKLVISAMLEKGIAHIRACDVGTPDYFLSATGTSRPFANLALDMKGQFNFSEKATQDLTSGKDLSDKLPYENGGIILPVTITGNANEPVIRPDLSKILDQAKKEKIGGALTSLLKSKDQESSSQEGSSAKKDSSSVEEGKKLLKGLFG